MNARELGDPTTLAQILAERNLERARSHAEAE
jgi:hypothetical protein